LSYLRLKHFSRLSSNPFQVVLGERVCVASRRKERAESSCENNSPKFRKVLAFSIVFSLLLHLLSRSQKRQPADTPPTSHHGRYHLSDSLFLSLTVQPPFRNSLSLPSLDHIQQIWVAEHPKMYNGKRITKLPSKLERKKSRSKQRGEKEVSSLASL